MPRLTEGLRPAGHLYARPNDGRLEVSDPVVDEVRKHRDARAARFGYDIRAIFEDAKKREREGGRKVISRVRERPDR